MDGLDCLGCDEVGFIGPLLQAAGGLMEGGANVLEQQKAEEKKEAEQRKQSQKVQDAIRIDADATLAAARAMTSAKQHMKSATADAKERASKEAQANAAGQGLGEDGTRLRIAAASQALADAQKSAASKPTETYPAILVQAWTNTLSKLQGSVRQGSTDGNQESWLTRRVVGPLSGSTVLVGAGILGVLGFLVFKRR